MRRSFVTTLAASLLLWPSTLVGQYPRDWDVDVFHYRFFLTLSDDTDAIEDFNDIVGGNSTRL